MGRWMTFFAFISIVGFILTALLAGGGFASTYITQAIPAVGFTGTIYVEDVTGFLNASVSNPAYIQIDDEIFYYTSNPDPTTESLISVTRAATDPQTGVVTSAANHAIGAELASTEIKAIDSFMGYNISTTGATFGSFSALTLVSRFFTNIPRYIEWDYPWFQGMGQLIRFALFAFSMGFVLSFAIAVIATAFGIFKP